MHKQDCWVNSDLSRYFFTNAVTTDTLLHTTVIIHVIYELFNHIVEHKCFHLLSYIWYLSIDLTLNRTPMWPIASNQIVANYLKMNSKGIYRG